MEALNRRETFAEWSQNLDEHKRRAWCQQTVTSGSRHTASHAISDRISKLTHENEHALLLNHITGPYRAYVHHQGSKSLPK